MTSKSVNESVLVLLVRRDESRRIQQGQRSPLEATLPGFQIVAQRGCHSYVTQEAEAVGESGVYADPKVIKGEDAGVDVPEPDNNRSQNV